MSLSWREYIVLNQEHINDILKYESLSKEVYIYEFGCITFANFSNDEIRVVLEYISSIIENFNYNLIYRFHESHTIRVLDDGNCYLWKSSKESVKYETRINNIISMILAKSVALNRIEEELVKLLDEGEKLIAYLRKPIFLSTSKKFMNIVSKVLKFEYDTVKNVKIFERAFYGNEDLSSKEIYDELSKYFELQDRFKIIKSKIQDLRHISKAYLTFSFRRNEGNLYVFEIILLALFPLSHGIGYLLEKVSIQQFLRILFK